MSGKHPTKKGKKPTKHTNRSVSVKQTELDKYASKTTFKPSRHYDLYPPRETLNLGTVYQAVKNKRIVSALSLIPVEFLKTLYYHGWILKTNERNSKYSDKTLVSLHPNLNLARSMTEKHDAGLIWTNDVSTGHVQWSNLKPWVMVNRFPRDGYPEIKLCGHGMVGKSEYDDFHPRTYPNMTVESGFMQDFALTACVSLLRAFVDKIITYKKVDKNITNKKVDKVLLLALRFAVEKCSAYITDGKLIDFDTGEELKAEWKMFFKNYRKIVNGKRRYTATHVRKSDYEELRFLKTTARELVEELSAMRPQTEKIDGYNNIWILKSKRPPTTDESILFNDVDDALKHFPGLKVNGGGDDYVIQKYVETPLLNNAHKFMLHAWLVISTLDKHLSVWLYQTCTTQTSVYKFSLDVNGRRYSPNAHLMRKLDRMHSTTQTVELKLLKSKWNAMLGVNHGMLGKTAAVSSRIKSSIVSAITAAANGNGNVLNLRPNCFELFQASFVVGHNLQPWLINIRSDPTPVHSIKLTMQYTMGNIAKNMAEIIVCTNRMFTAEIGKFGLIHQGPIPGQEYGPRDFIVISKKPKNKHHRNDHDYIESFPLEDSDSSVESLVDDSEDEIEIGPIKSVPPQRTPDEPKIDLEMSKTYIYLLDRMQENLNLIRKLSGNKER